MSGRDANQRRGCVEIRWNEDDPDDVVAPWPRELDGTPILVHIERMDDDHIWLAIYDQATGEDVHMDIVSNGPMRWTVRDA